MGRPKGSTNRPRTSTRSASFKAPQQQQQQNKLPFSNRITKPSPALTATGKKASSIAQQKALKLEEELSSANVSAIEPEEEGEKSAVEMEVEEEEQAEDEESVKEDVKEEAREEKLALRQQVPNIAGGRRDEVEEKAGNISEAQINKYWKSVDDERKGPRIHQADLSLHERVLRHFDMSSHFGPCIGIPRTKRWKRAQRLGLNPPIEVLAVLLKDDPVMDKQRIQRAHVDELVNARFALTLGEQERGVGGRKMS